MQIFSTKVYGTLVCGLRLMEVPGGMGAKNASWSPVLIVQGPTEPGSLRGVTEAIKAFFMKHDPGMDCICLFTPFPPVQ